MPSTPNDQRSGAGVSKRAIAAQSLIDWEGDDVGALIEYCYEQGWSDGLPLVPPLRPLVEAMLSTTSLAPKEVLASHPPTGRRCTVLAAATNAVMAGCRPEYFPVVVAALKAMDHPDFLFHGSTASTGGSAPLVIVSGPYADRIGMNSRAGVFGSGNRANATIGRTIRLVIINVFQMVIGISDQSTQGHPGKYTFCIAEREDANPWDPLWRELGFDKGDTSVTVYAGSGFTNVENHGGNTPEAILDCVADGMGNLSCLTRGQSVVVLSPEHAKIIASAGWSKSEVKAYLFDQAKRGVDRMKEVGKYSGNMSEHDKAGFFHRGITPEDILVTVAGGDAGGHSAFIPSWSRTRSSIMQSARVECESCVADNVQQGGVL